jgi:membrane protease YdiL (CAAX protease family)
MATSAPVQPSAPRQGVLARHPLVSFFLLTFLFSWGWWGLWKALQMPTPLIYVRTAGPTIAAFVVLAITSGRPGVLGLLRSYVHWRVGVQWYLVALIGVPVLLFLSFAVVPGALAEFVAPDWSFIPAYVTAFAYSVFLAGGPLLEEGGWRGFALPRLQRLRGLLVGTLILGVFWASWHLPGFFGPLALTGPDDTFLGTGIYFVEYVIGVIGLSYIMTWVFNNTQGSVLMAILLHAGFDASAMFDAIFPSIAKIASFSPISLNLGTAIVFGFAALVIIIATRGRLSYQRCYQRYEREVELPPATSRRVR